MSGTDPLLAPIPGAESSELAGIKLIPCGRALQE